MDNPETLATLGTQDKTKKKSTTQKAKNMSNTDRTKKPEVKPGARDNIPALLLTYSQVR